MSEELKEREETMRRLNIAAGNFLAKMQKEANRINLVFVRRFSPLRDRLREHHSRTPEQEEKR